jgi:hypothetical protein
MMTDELSYLLRALDFNVTYVYGGNLGTLGNPPQVIIAASNESDLLDKRLALESLLTKFYKNRVVAPELKLKITLIEGLGTEQYFPKYGLCLHSGQLDADLQDVTQYHREFEYFQTYIKRMHH